MSKTKTDPKKRFGMPGQPYGPGKDGWRETGHGIRYPDGWTLRQLEDAVLAVAADLNVRTDCDCGAPHAVVHPRYK